NDRHVEHLCVRKPATNAHWLCALKQVVVAVVKQLPREGKQKRGGFFGVLDFIVRRAGFNSDVDINRKTTTGMIANSRPGIHDVCRMDHRHRSFVQKLSPLHEVLFDLPSAIAKVVAGPDCVFLQVPAQFFGLDWSNWRNQSPVLRAMYFWLAWCRRLVN